MTTFINIQNREQFELCKDHIAQADLMVVDTETNGLQWYNKHSVISISIYFPQFDTAYNLPFNHGVGSVEIDYTEANSEVTLFENMNWQGKAKKQAYLKYWYQNYYLCPLTSWNNIPYEWVEELILYWDKPVHLYHNALFDLHMLHKLGFPTPKKVYDTLVLLHVVFEDWSGIRVTAPFVWTEADRKKGLCRDWQVGQWARQGDTLMTREQNGNRQLKWQAAWLELPDATAGEESLFKAIRDFEEKLTDFIMLHLDNPYNDSLRYKDAKKQASPEQRERIRDKIALDTKANLWMLPAADVAYYAMLDVVLTWQLYEYWKPTIQAWHNEALYEDMCQTLMLSWQMESNGIKLDVEAAKSEVERIDPMIVAVQNAVNEVAHKIGYGQDVNLGSPKQLLAFLSWENEKKETVLSLPMGYETLPAWYHDDDRIAALATYAGAKPHSTEHKVLEDYEDHPLIMLIFEWRRLKKSSDTYLKNWLKARDAQGMVHAGMNSTGTVAGRWSSSGDSGNFQNIPDRNGYRIKSTLIAPDGWVLVGLDYGQLEARLAAYIAEVLMPQWGVHSIEPKMMPMFNDNVDMHAYTRDMIGVRDVVYPNMSDREILVKLGYKLSDIPEDKQAALVAKLCRHIAKTLNFGLLYSGGKRMVSKLLRVSLEVADVLVKRWRDLFPVFGVANRYYTDLALTWRENPAGNGMAQYVTQPISNRHRKFHKYDKWAYFYEDGIRKGFNPQEAAASKGWNNVVQGLGGYICTMSGVHIMEKYGNDKVRMFAQIHDALDMYVRADSLHIVKDMVTIMTDWDVNPRLTVEIAGSTDGTWQTISPVHDFDLWADSKGELGC